MNFRSSIPLPPSLLCVVMAEIASFWVGCVRLHIRKGRAPLDILLYIQADTMYDETCVSVLYYLG